MVKEAEKQLSLWMELHPEVFWQLLQWLREPLFRRTSGNCSNTWQKKTSSPIYILHVVMISHMRSGPQALSNYIPARSWTGILGQSEQQKHGGASSVSLGEPINVLCRTLPQNIFPRVSRTASKLWTLNYPTNHKEPFLIIYLYYLAKQ